MNYLLKIILIGFGATLTLDTWINVLRLFKIKSLDYRYVGRWVGNFPRGKFLHSNIMNAEPVYGEMIIGWTAHYLIGITFAFFLFFLFGKEWIEKPILLPAVLIGLLTVIAPLFVMQPAFGFGIASSNLPNPASRIVKSLLTHLVYGIGLYLTALLITKF